jgi:hypothetical protein
MKYALNKNKGTVINHPEVGILEGNIAYEITDEQALMLKNVIGIIIFDKVQKLE